MPARLPIRERAAASVEVPAQSESHAWSEPTRLRLQNKIVLAALSASTDVAMKSTPPAAGARGVIEKTAMTALGTEYVRIVSGTFEEIWDFRPGWRPSD